MLDPPPGPLKAVLADIMAPLHTKSKSHIIPSIFETASGILEISHFLTNAGYLFYYHYGQMLMDHFAVEYWPPFG